jgi:hypothetical protein
MMAQDPPPSAGEMKNNNQLAMGACDEEGKGGKAMATTIRVTGNKEGKGNKEGNGIGDKGGVQRRGQWLQRQEQWRRE